MWKWIPALMLSSAALLSGTAAVAQWEEPEVIVLTGDEPAPTNAVEAMQSISVDNLPAPLYQHEIDALVERANASIVPVRAVFIQDPLLYPPEVEVQGCATLVENGSGQQVFVTARYLVDGADRVVFDLPSGPVSAIVSADARFGLASLVPTRPLDVAVTSVRLTDAGADTREEAFSVGRNSIGSTIGAGESQYGFYQISTVGVTLGYPLLNRDGDLLGVGSHRYPTDPQYTLVVPAGAVRDYFEASAPQE